ncbi:MAG: response regulator transcription factor [Bacteroidetes bacterium]|nr:MAG: response regulator transcription factor [Bacteroidota bacterium]
MNILIIEDEEPAAARLKRMILEIEPEARIAAVIVSIRSAVSWLKTNPAPALIFQDIQLADGISFEIFNQVDVQSPIIFTTAFDEYAIQAFKVNSIDYLLKPLKKEDLIKAINKFKKLKNSATTPPDLEDLIATLKGAEKKYKSRFLIRYADHIKKVDINEVAYFYTQDKINYLRTTAGQSYPIEYNLDTIEKTMDPEKYFRINRQFIIGIDSIEQMFAFSKSRVKIKLKPSIDIETIVSTDRSPHFKAWLGDES